MCENTVKMARIDCHSLLTSFTQSNLVYNKNGRFSDGRRSFLHLLPGLVADNNSSICNGFVR